ncbi:MAG: hypothetical protein IPL75_08260 [Acidobacteria bacterium]|nr:hypothetical protein [Acidobacteriota bacterium]
MTIRGLSVALPTIVAACAVVVSAQVPRVINLTGNDSLHYSPTTITATPGETITVVLRTISMQPAAQMAHNFVILKPGANVDQFTMLAGMARDHDFIPPKLKDQILVATPMAAANEVAKATFTAPTTPGTYVYFCTYPAHYSGGMKGTLVVKYDRRHTGCSNTGVTSPPRCPMSHADSERLLVLMDHIITTHHDHVRRAIPDITRRLRSLSAAAGPERAELPVA